MRLNQTLKKAKNDFRQRRCEFYTLNGTEEATARNLAEKDTKRFAEMLERYADIYQQKEYYDRYLHILLQSDDEAKAIMFAAEYSDTITSDTIESAMEVLLNCFNDHYLDDYDFALQLLIPLPDEYLCDDATKCISAGEAVNIPYIKLSIIDGMLESDLIDETAAAYLMHTTEETLQLLLDEYYKPCEEEETMTPVIQE